MAGGLCRYFLRLGALGFGGPVALAGYMQRDLAEERDWVSPQEYRDCLAIAQMAPGPLVRGRVHQTGDNGGLTPRRGPTRSLKMRRCRRPHLARNAWPGLSRQPGARASLESVSELASIPARGPRPRLPW